MPKRDDETAAKADAIYFIDVPQPFFDACPENIRQQAVVLTQAKTNGFFTYKDVINRYELLRDTAKLVVTIRYHIATPCAAMGIPVMMVENCSEQHHWTFDPRLNAMNPQIPFYTKEHIAEGCIDWNPPPANFEDAKRNMLDLAISRIRNAAEIYTATNRLNDFYSPSRERFLDIFNENKDKIDCFGFSYYLDTLFLLRIKGDFKYVLYGLSDRFVELGRCNILDYVKKHYPNAEFLGFADIAKKGSAFGKKILHPSEIDVDENTVVLVSAFTANEYARKLFEDRGWDLNRLWEMSPMVIYYVYHL